MLDPDLKQSQQLDMHFTSQARLEEANQIVIRPPGKVESRIARYLRNRPNHGPMSPNPSIDAYMAAVHLRFCGQRDQWCDGRHTAKVPVGPGGLGLYDLRRSWMSDIRDPFHTVNFQVPRWMLDDLADELKAPKIETLTPPADGETDDVLMHLALAFVPTLTRPWEAGKLFAEHMFALVTVHLARAYGGLKARSVTPRGTLAPWQENRAKELLLHNLCGDIETAELAGACGLSGGYFSRAFKQATGLPPHRWLQTQRVRVAKQLLENTTGHLAEVALKSGFADQSHFTRVFAKLVGTTPGAWRRLRRG